MLRKLNVGIFYWKILIIIKELYI